MSKFVIAPLNIKDMNQDLESKEVYIFDYKKSKINGNDFYNYITNIGVIGDIYFDETISYEEKENILLRYMNDKRFLHFSSLNATIFDIIHLVKNINIHLDISIFSIDEEIKFFNNHKELIINWKQFYDSLFMFNLCLATLPLNCTNKTEAIKNRFKDIEVNNNDTLSPNMVSLLLDDYFFSYYDSGINESIINYYPYYFENNLYDEKNIIPYLLDTNNYYLSIIRGTIFSNEN